MLWQSLLIRHRLSALDEDGISKGTTLDTNFSVDEVQILVCMDEATNSDFKRSCKN
jgi:hypothetical protein